MNYKGKWPSTSEEDSCLSHCHDDKRNKDGFENCIRRRRIDTLNVSDESV